MPVQASHHNPLKTLPTPQHLHRHLHQHQHHHQHLSSPVLPSPLPSFLSYLSTPPPPPPPHRLNQVAFPFCETSFGREPSGRHAGAWRTRWCRTCAAGAQDALILAPRADGDPDGPGFGATPFARRSTEPEDSHKDRVRGTSCSTRPSSGSASPPGGPASTAA